MVEDGAGVDFPNFYHAPLGADPVVFRPWPSVPRNTPLFTSGYVAEAEAVRECEEATRRLGLKMFHLGPDLGFKPHVRWRNGINDAILSQIYAQCQFVAGLRRIEGFELPAVEGLFCGARPVMFDAPHYRRWFEDLATFIPEGDFEQVVRSLEHVLQNESGLTVEQYQLARERFDWANLVPPFWQFVQKRFDWGTKVAEELLYKGTATEQPTGFLTVNSKPILLFCGDAVVSSGFAKGTHKTCDVLQKYFDIHILGINYFGDPHPYPYKVWSCRGLKSPPNDAFGISRIPELIFKLRPSIVVVQNDWWNFKPYLQAIGNTPVVGIVAVDGKNCSRARELNGLKHAIFWTEFGRKQAHLGGYEGPSSVIPLGVDLEVFKPTTTTKRELRERAGWPIETHEAFIVGNVNRNQLRKRMDLVVSRFAEWVKDYKVNDAYLFCHTSPTGDVGFDIQQGMEYYGLANRLILSQPEPGFGAPEKALRALYCAIDLMFTQTQGEGFGLPHIEAAACGVTSAVPQWSALAEWPGDAFWQIPVTDTAWTLGGPNTIGGIADPLASVQALHHLYSNRQALANFNQQCIQLVQDPRYRWENIGEAVNDVLQGVLNHRAIDIVPKVNIADPQQEVMVQ
jgi:glycosyltransferase involved in cell wall biosynthesis